MKQKAKKLKKDLFIVDTGDTHDGDGLSDVTDPRGEVTQPLITNIPYDILTIGNHELYGMYSIKKKGAVLTLSQLTTSQQIPFVILFLTGMVVIWLPMFILKIYKPTKRLKSGKIEISNDLLQKLMLIS